MTTLQRTQAIPLNNYATGSRALPEVSVPDAATLFYIELQRCTTADPTIWPNESTQIKLDLEITYDNGVTWRDFAGFTDGGGIAVRNGIERQVTSLKAPMEPGTRKLRGTVQVISGPLRTQGFYEARDGV